MDELVINHKERYISIPQWWWDAYGEDKYLPKTVKDLINKGYNIQLNLL